MLGTVPTDGVQYKRGPPHPTTVVVVGDIATTPELPTNGDRPGTLPNAEGDVGAAPGTTPRLVPDASKLTVKFPIDH